MNANTGCCGIRAEMVEYHRIVSDRDRVRIRFLLCLSNNAMHSTDGVMVQEYKTALCNHIDAGMKVMERGEMNEKARERRWKM